MRESMETPPDAAEVRLLIGDDVIRNGDFYVLGKTWYELNGHFAWHDRCIGNPISAKDNGQIKYYRRLEDIPIEMSTSISILPLILGVGVVATVLCVRAKAMKKIPVARAVERANVVV